MNLTNRCSCKRFHVEFFEIIWLPIGSEFFYEYILKLCLWHVVGWLSTMKMVSSIKQSTWALGENLIWINLFLLSLSIVKFFSYINDNNYLTLWNSFDTSGFTIDSSCIESIWPILSAAPRTPHKVDTIRSTLAYKIINVIKCLNAFAIFFLILINQ